MPRGKMVTPLEIARAVQEKRDPYATPITQLDQIPLLPRSMVREITWRVRRAERKGLLLLPPDPNEPL